MILDRPLAYAATRVDALLVALPALAAAPSNGLKDASGRSSGWLLEAVESDLAELEPQVQTLATRRDQLKEQSGSLARYEATLRQLLPVTPVHLDFEHYAVSAIWTEARYQPVLAYLSRQLEELTAGQGEVLTRSLNADLVVALLIFPRSQAQAVNELLGRENIGQVRLPPELAGQSLDQSLTYIQQRRQAIPHELSQIEAQQAALAQAWRSRLLNWQALLRDHLARLEVQADLGQTDYTFIIEGWAPEARLAEIQESLQRGVGDEVVVVKLPLSAEEQAQAPVMFDNPRLVTPFEPLLGLLALPRSGHFDPTPLMALFFPLFFGMILGDVAYGIILLLVMLYLRRRLKSRPTLRALTEALSMAAGWSIVFGFLYGEFLGALGEEFGLRPLWFDRGHNIQALFLLAIGLGAGHVVLGLDSPGRGALY